MKSGQLFCFVRILRLFQNHLLNTAWRIDDIRGGKMSNQTYEHTVEWQVFAVILLDSWKRKVFFSFCRDGCPRCQAVFCRETVKKRDANARGVTFQRESDPILEEYNVAIWCLRDGCEVCITPQRDILVNLFCSSVLFFVFLDMTHETCHHIHCIT